MVSEQTEVERLKSLLRESEEVIRMLLVENHIGQKEYFKAEQMRVRLSDFLNGDTK